MKTRTANQRIKSLKQRRKYLGVLLGREAENRNGASIQGKTLGIRQSQLCQEEADALDWAIPLVEKVAEKAGVLHRGARV